MYSNTYLTNHAMCEFLCESKCDRLSVIFINQRFVRKFSKLTYPHAFYFVGFFHYVYELLMIIRFKVSKVRNTLISSLSTNMKHKVLLILKREEINQFSTLICYVNIIMHSRMLLLLDSFQFVLLASKTKSEEILLFLFCLFSRLSFVKRHYTSSLT